jgi:hypothetical protein
VCSAPAAFCNCARRICPPVVWPARAGRKPDSSRPWIRHCRRSPPYSPRNLAARVRDYSGRAPAKRQPRAAAPRTWPWAGRSDHGPLARVAGERCRGGGRRLTARNLRPYAYLNRRRRASLIRPAKESSVVSREATRDFGTIVRCRGRSSGWLARPRGKPAGRNRARVSAPPGRGHRLACWAPELARNWD